MAALKTIEIMQRDKTYKKIKNIGKKIKEIWQQLSIKHKLKIKIYGLDSIPCFQFLYKNHLAYKTFLTQEMLKNRILATTQIYISIAHEQKHLKNYKNKLDNIFKSISEFEKKNIPVNSFLEF